MAAGPAGNEFQRLAARLGAEPAGEITVSTFHALGWRILRGHAELLGYRPGISILDEDGLAALLAGLR